MEDIHIRRAVFDDVVPLSLMARVAFCETFHHYNPTALNQFLDSHCSVNAFNEALTAGNITFFVAMFGEHIVGYAKFGDSRLPQQSLFIPTFELHQLYVLKAWHGRKIGAKLMEKVIAAGRKCMVPAIYLGVWEHNIPAQAFYRKYGFVKVGNYDYLPIGDVIDHEWIMEKTL